MRAHTHTLTQGLELSGEGVGDKRSEIDVSTEMILSSPELVLTDPTSSVTGRALRGLLTAQSAVTVSLQLVMSYVDSRINRIATGIMFST